jgi:hypothetical protein
MSFSEVQTNFPGHEIVVHEKHAPEPPTVPPVKRSQVQAVLDAHPEDAAKQPQNSRITTKDVDNFVEEVKESGVAQVIESNELLNKALQEFKILLAKYYANEQDTKAKIEVQAVGNFILALAPDMAPELQAAKDSFTKPRFNL